MNDKIYYNGNKVLSYNTIWNLVLGARRIGKTYFYKRKAILDFINKGHQFIYLRRYKEEINTLREKDGFCEDIRKDKLLEGVEIKHQRNTILVNGKIAGFIIKLSSSVYMKSVSFAKVNMIIFDEVLLEKGNINYIPNEVNALKGFYDTVSTNRDIRLIMLSNSVTSFNPYFLDFNITKLEKGINIYGNGQLAVELYEDAFYQEYRENTKFGLLNSNTSYGDYSNSGQFLLDTNDFIEERPKTANFYFSIKEGESQLGVWKDYDSGFMYVSEKFDKSSKLIFSSQLDSHNANTILSKNNFFVKSFITSFKLGGVLFENQHVKGICFSFIKKAGL